MILLIDVGNSNIVFGYAKEREIEQTFRFRTFLDKTTDEYYLMLKSMLDLYKIDDVIISSVVPVVTSALKKLFMKFYKIDAKVLGQGLKTGIQLKVDDPKTVGADIICDCVGAMVYSDEAIIVDLGTATKYIYCKRNVFYGVSIAPGVSVSMKAMVSSAALLPQMELVCPKKVIGTSTIPCMQSGVMYGAASQVDGMVERIKEEVNANDIKVYATGGLSSLITPLCKNEIIRVENLTLLGLLEIYYKNI